MAPNKHSPTTVVIRFFKIILRQTLEDGNLKMPNSFTIKYGGALQNPVHLNPPDGTEWKVHWTKHDGGILFEKGWKEFATYYCLDHGHLVVFEYNKETSHFEVHIFGMSGLEIDYPDDTVEILNEPPPCMGQKTRLKSPLSSPSASKKLRTATRTSPNPAGSQSEETKLEMPVVASANQDLHGKKSRRKQDSRSLPSPFPATSEALNEAKEFNSKNPFFMVKINQRSLVGRYSPPHFSAVFYKKYFKQDRQNVKLRFERKLWPAKLICYTLNSYAVISAGWAPFAKASELQAGDVCVFELVNGKDPVLHVHVFRG